MKSQIWISGEIERLVKQLIRSCPHTPSNLNEHHRWTAIKTLCEVIEFDSCLIWNTLVEACPFYGEVTECSEL